MDGGRSVERGGDSDRNDDWLSAASRPANEFFVGESSFVLLLPGMRTISYIASALLLCPALGSAQEIIKSVHGFADVNFDMIEGTGSDSRFKLGEHDTYVTGTLDSRTSYLSEITVEHEGTDGWELALERFWVRYEFNQLLNASVGKFHSAVGYWNRTYHHGSFLFASIDKPVSRSLFPIHTTGLLLSGKQSSGARISYDLMIGNGTGGSPKSDNDNGKGCSLVFTLPFSGLL